MRHHTHSKRQFVNELDLPCQTGRARRHVAMNAIRGVFERGEVQIQRQRARQSRQSGRSAWHAPKSWQPRRPRMLPYMAPREWQLRMDARITHGCPYVKSMVMMSSTLTSTPLGWEATFVCLMVQVRQPLAQRHQDHCAWSLSSPTPKISNRRARQPRRAHELWDTPLAQRLLQRPVVKHLRAVDACLASTDRAIRLLRCLQGDGIRLLTDGDMAQDMNTPAC